MASDSNNMVLKPSEEQVRMSAHSNDQENSSNIQHELSLDDLNLSSRTVLEHSANFTTTFEASANEPANFIKFVTKDSASTSEKNLHDAASFSKKVSDEGGSISIENQTVSSVKRSKDPPLSNEDNIFLDFFDKIQSNKIINRIIIDEVESAEVIKPAHSKEAELMKMLHSRMILHIHSELESSKVIQLVHSEQTEPAKMIQPVHSEQNEPAKMIQLVHSEQTESTKMIQPVHSEQTESTKVFQSAHFGETEVIKSTNSENTKIIQSPVAEDIKSIQIMQPSLDEEIQTIPIIQTVHSEEVELTEVKDPVISKENNLNKVTPIDSLESSCFRKAEIYSPKSKKARIDGKNKSLEPAMVSKDFTEIASDYFQFEENSNSSFPPALDTKSFLSVLNTEEYKNATHFVIPGKGQVIVSPSIQCEPIFPDFVMPSLSPPTNNPSMESTKPLSSNKDVAVNKDTFSKISLSTLLSAITDWLQINIEKCFDNHEQHNFECFQNNSKMEFQYGLDLLKQMNERISTLLRAVDGLLEPTTILRNERISFHHNLTSSGLEVKMRLMALEAETENYNKIVSLCYGNRELSNEFCTKHLAIKAKDSFLKLSEYVVRLCVVIENFRDQIRDFCLEIDRFL